jgi:membrane protein
MSATPLALAHDGNGMRQRQIHTPLTGVALAPGEGLLILWRALTRLWGRDVMLYVGGVSFFALLAVFPALALTIGVYSLLLTPHQVVVQADAFAHVLPSAAGAILQGELRRLAAAPPKAVSIQSGVALAIGLYAAHRGFKALIAGLTFIHDEPTPMGFFGFNLLAFVVLVGAFLLASTFSALFLTVRMAASTLHLEPLKHVPWFLTEWTWSSIGLTFGLALVYRYAMSSTRVDWRASIIGGMAAAAMSLLASWASALYVRQFAHFGATYGSIAATVVILVWLSWTVNGLFFGGALATEVEIAFGWRKPRR